ncbi:MAG: M13-type metalloendopeptidase, partial [Cyclobacteriaceae bacterium]
PEDIRPGVNLTYGMVDFIYSVSVRLWKDYFTRAIVEENIHFLTDSIAISYNARVENFTTRNITNYNSADRAILLLIDLMPDEMIKLYGFSERRHQAILSMAEHIRNVMVETVQSNESIDSAASIHLTDQLKSINLNCAIPDEFFSYDELYIDEFDVLGNIRRAEEFNYRRWVESASSGNLHNRQYMESLDGSPAFFAGWNSVLLPISFSKIPLFNETYDDAYNYGALGFYVGHEIAHSFHLKSDSVVYILSDSVEEAIIDQYGSYRTYSGDTLNGRLTRFENFTDIVGLNAALNAYKQVPSYKKTLNGRTGPQRFFMAFANSQRQYVSPERTDYLINYDEHTISYLRVNGTVRNMDDFYEAFSVQPDDSLYLSEDERLYIW